MKMSLPGAPVRVVLRSAFAEDEGDFLEFVLAGDTVEMMETPWTRRLDDKVSTNHEHTCERGATVPTRTNLTRAAAALLVPERVQVHPRIHRGHHAGRVRAQHNLGGADGRRRRGGAVGPWRLTLRACPWRASRSWMRTRRFSSEKGTVDTCPHTNSIPYAPHGVLPASRSVTERGAHMRSVGGSGGGAGDAATRTPAKRSGLSAREASARVR